jgi:hypothetical protein
MFTLFLIVRTLRAAFLALRSAEGMTMVSLHPKAKDCGDVSVDAVF